VPSHTSGAAMSPRMEEAANKGGLFSTMSILDYLRKPGA
jgi:hypothetical protein